MNGQISTASSKKNMLQTPPGPSERILIRAAHHIRQDSLGFQLNMLRQYGDLVRLRIGFGEGYLVCNPEHIKHVLQTNFRNYGYLHKSYKPFFGEGILSSDGTTWRNQRLLVQPAFHRQRLAAFGSRITRASSSMLDHWSSFAEHSKPINVAEEMMLLTQEIISLFLFNQNLYNAEVSNSILSAAYREFANSLWNPLNSYIDRIVPLSIPIPHHRLPLAARHMLDQMAQKMIIEHSRLDEDNGDVLSILLKGNKERDQKLTTQQIRDQLITLFMTGHETVANLLSWTFYLVSQHPDVAHRLQVELKTVLNGQLPTVEHLGQLGYTRMILEESMRVYPSAWATNREAKEDDTLGCYRIPKMSRMWISLYALHHHPNFWEEPEKFDPERFNPDRSVTCSHKAFLPFGIGPRQCIGKDFALMEALLILATVAQRYQLHLVPNFPVEPEVLITLRPKHGLLMTLQPI